MRAGTGILVALLALAGPDSGAGETPGTSGAAPGVGHAPAFWTAIAKDGYKVPPGESADALLIELNDYLGSPDPQLRDDCAYSTAAAWIYRDKRVAPETLRTLLQAWRANLRKGVGQRGSNELLLRSFSALDLSVLAALDNERPWLDDEEFEGLLSAAVDYLGAEKDLRAFDPRLGWLHATAHTADLLKFLGRSARLRPAGQARILAAVGTKIGASPEAFSHGENERLAAAVQSIVMRPDFDAAAFTAFVSSLGRLGEHLWDKGPLVDPNQYATVQNAKDLLRSLYVGLSLRDSAGRSESARKEILRVLAGLS